MSQVVFKSQEKLLPINPTTWPTLSYQDIGKSIRLFAQFVVLSGEKKPFSDKSRFFVKKVGKSIQSVYRPVIRCTLR
jgi:hypothetical protein